MEKKYKFFGVKNGCATVEFGWSFFWAKHFLKAHNGYRIVAIPQP